MTTTKEADVNTPALEHVMTVHLTMAPGSLIQIPNLPSGGARWSINTAGGTFEGPGMRGRVLPGGIENPLYRDDEVLMINARWQLETDDGVVIHVQNRGIRRGLEGPEAMRAWISKAQPVSAPDFYFRVAPIFEAPTGKYDWLTRHLFIGTLVDAPSPVDATSETPGPSIQIFKVL